MSKRPYIVGEVKGYPVGSTFEDRKTLAEAGLHRSVRRGIDWGVGEPACSIVLSAGYSIDKDMGKIVIYSGEGGGLDPSTKGHDKQITDQEWKRGNAALLRAFKEASPVRLIRSFRCQSDWAPPEGLRYDGLYTVTKADLVKSKAGLEVCVFKLISQPRQGPIPRKTGYGSVTMYESSDMEDSDKEEDQLEQEEYRTPPSTKCWPPSILDLPLDSDSESDEELFGSRSYKASQNHSATASSSKRTLDFIEFSSGSEDEDNPSPSKKSKSYHFGPKSCRTAGHRPKMIHSPEVIEILDTDEEQELPQRQQMPIANSQGNSEMREDQPRRELGTSGEPRKVQRATSRHRWLLETDDEDDDGPRSNFRVRARIRPAPNESHNGYIDSHEHQALVAEDDRSGTEVTDEDDLKFVLRELDHDDVKEEDQDICMAIAELQRAHELAFGKPEGTHEKQDRIVIDLTGDD